MEIIKFGNRDKAKPKKRFVCSNCGCEFIADNTEYQSASQIEFFHDGIRRKCKCPCCQKMVYAHE